MVLQHHRGEAVAARMFGQMLIIPESWFTATRSVKLNFCEMRELTRDVQQYYALSDFSVRGFSDQRCSLTSDIEPAQERVRRSTDGDKIMTTVLTSTHGRRYYTNKDLQKLFGVSRATIDRWCREKPNFPKKVNLVDPWHAGHGSVRFLVAEVEAYLSGREEAAGINLAA